MHIPPSLLTQLPALIAQGQQEASEAVIGARETAELNGSYEPNALIHGDNLAGLARLVASGACAKLIYLDPPFDSKADYRSRIHTRDDAGGEIALEMHTYTDRWAGGTADYLRMLVPRLVLARQLLAEDGAICVHLDWHSSHYVRVVLDEVFGREHFVNSLVWSYRTGGAARTSAVPRKHDNLLLYRKSDRFRITPLYERQYLDKPFMGSKVDAQGRHFVDTILRDVLEGAVTLVDSAADAPTGGGVHQVSVRPVLNLSAERTGYATQKPEGLLELLLRWMTHPGDLVVDPFGGSGTTAATAEQLGRRWMSLDASARSLVVTRSRLDALGAQYALLDAHPPQNTDSVVSPMVEYAWEDGEFQLQSVIPAEQLATALQPARGQSSDVTARMLEGTGLGSLAGWHLWSTAGERLGGAWRDARGVLVPRASIAQPVADSVTLELVDLTGKRTTVANIVR